MIPKRPKYRAYLLRLWETQDTRGLTWRVSLEDISTHTRHGFASLEKAFAFLHEHLTSDLGREDSFNKKGGQ